MGRLAEGSKIEPLCEAAIAVISDLIVPDASIMPRHCASVALVALFLGLAVLAAAQTCDGVANVFVEVGLFFLFFSFFSFFFLFLFFF